MGESNKSEEHPVIKKGCIIGDWVVLNSTYIRKSGSEKKFLLCACPHLPEGIPVSVNNLTTGQSFGCHLCGVKSRTKNNKEENYWLERFRNIRNRCHNPNNPSYKTYGGRGITVYSEWLEDPLKFVKYICTVLGGNTSLEVDRIDNNSGYIPGNIRLVTREENMHNVRTNRWVVFNGEKMVLRSFIKKYTSCPWSTAHGMLSRGITPEEISKKYPPSI